MLKIHAGWWTYFGVPMPPPPVAFVIGRPPWRPEPEPPSLVAALDRALARQAA